VGSLNPTTHHNSLSAATMAKKISASVGKSGKNKPEDVQIVQELLNDFTKMCGFKKLDVDGQIGSKTLSAIAEFQKTAVGMSKPDSRVDPGGPSFTTLTKGPKKAEAEAKKAEEAEKEKKEKEEAKKAKPSEEKEKEESKPQVKGETRGVDKKILAVLEAVSAHYGKTIVVECGKKEAANVDAKDLWKKWLSELDRGRKFAVLSQNNKLRKDLDELYNDGQEDKFIKLCHEKTSADSKATTAHASGHAVDLKRNTDSKVLAALSSILRYEDEGDVLHFDDVGKNVPSKITDDMKKKWK
jgi:hypothetical protein